MSASAARERYGWDNAAVLNLPQEERRERLNAEMRAIFARHGVDHGLGDEMFWEAVDEVAQLSDLDADELEALAEEWMR